MSIGKFRPRIGIGARAGHGCAARGGAPEFRGAWGKVVKREGVKP